MVKKINVCACLMFFAVTFALGDLNAYDNNWKSFIWVKFFNPDIISKSSSDIPVKDIRGSLKCRLLGHPDFDVTTIANKNGKWELENIFVKPGEKKISFDLALDGSSPSVKDLLDKIKKNSSVGKVIIYDYTAEGYGHKPYIYTFKGITVNNVKSKFMFGHQQIVTLECLAEKFSSKALGDGRADKKTVSKPVEKEKKIKNEQKTLSIGNTENWNFLPETVAQIGSYKITKDMIIHMAERPDSALAVSQKFNYLYDGSSLTKKDFRNFAVKVTDDLIDSKLYQNLAAKGGFKVTPEIKEECFKEWVNQFKEYEKHTGEQSSYQKMLKEYHTTESEQKKNLAINAVIQEWVKKKIIPEIKVSDTEIESFYDNNKENYKIDEKLKVLSILIMPDPMEKEAVAWKKAKNKAEKISADLKKYFKEHTKKQNTSYFMDLRSEYSQADTFMQYNGTVLTKGEKENDFEQKCWQTFDGELNEIFTFKTENGIYIVDFTGYQKGGYVPLDDQLKMNIKSTIEKEKLSEVLEKKLAEANKNSQIKIYIDNE